MSKKVGFYRLSDTGFHAHDENGERIVDLSDPPPYKPQYDMEVKGYHAPYEATIYFDVHTELTKFTSKHVLTAQLRGLTVILFHKYIGRHFR